MRVVANGRIHEIDSSGCGYRQFTEGRIYVVCEIVEDHYCVVADNGEPLERRSGFRPRNLDHLRDGSTLTRAA
jgi:hypothetical protein